MHKNKRKKYNSFFIVGLMVGILFSVTGVYAVTQYASNTVYYINKNSGLSSNNVQGAIDELATIHKPGNNDCPSGYVCTKNSDVYTINLDASFGISDSTDLNAGTVKIYLMKDDGIYLDRGYTKKMTTTENSITIPTVTGYTFKGYYNDSNEMLINENGYITSSFTNNKFSKNSTINAKWEANNYVITLNTNKPSPLNDGYYTNGTNTVYMKYGTGVYLDDAYTNKMTTSDNAVTKPTATGYNFLGYYDGDTQMIDANGKITSDFTNSKYASAKTLTAKWTRNFTCTPGGTNYMGKGWYVISNSNNICEMALNATVGNSSGNTYNAASGTGTGSVYSYIKSYSDNGVTLEKEYNAGLISSIDTSPGNVTGKPTGIYWISSGKIYSSTAYYKYTIPSTTYTITQGYVYTNNNTGSGAGANLNYHSGYTTDGYDTKPLVTAGGTASLSNTSSKFTYYNKPTSSSASSSSGGWSIYETNFTYNIGMTGKITTSCSSSGCYWGIPLQKIDYSNSGKTKDGTYGGRSFRWRFYSCGGSNRTYDKRIMLEMKNGTTTNSFYYSNYSNNKIDENRTTDAKMILQFGGRASRQNALISGTNTKTEKNIATFDFNSASNCRTDYKKWNSPTIGTVAVKYRPHIKVKMNT